MPCTFGVKSSISSSVRERLDISASSRRSGSGGSSNGLGFFGNGVSSASAAFMRSSMDGPGGGSPKSSSLRLSSTSRSAASSSRSTPSGISPSIQCFAHSGFSSSFLFLIARGATRAPTRRCSPSWRIRRGRLPRTLRALAAESDAARARATLHRPAVDETCDMVDARSIGPARTRPSCTSQWRVEETKPS